MEAKRAVAIALGRRTCWRHGDLSYKMHAGQLEVHGLLNSSGASRFVLEIARRWGKTFYLVLLAAETCLRQPGSRVVYGAPTLKHLEEFVLPVMTDISGDAPSDCRPEFNAASGHWRFPNGSWVHLFGADDKRKADRGRGPNAALAIFDEAGFTPVLKYVLTSVFRPSLMRGGGRTLLASTPAEEPDHDFTRMCETAEANGAWARKTIHDNPMLTNAQVAKFIEDDAKDNGMMPDEYVRTPEFRREYLAERVTDKTLAVMGDDWELAKETALVEWPRPEFFDAYVSMDMGGVDPHAALFGLWDFRRSSLVIEDEALLRDGENTKQLSDKIKAKETELYGSGAWNGTMRGAVEVEDLPDWLKESRSDGWQPQPYLRVCDNDVQIARDLVQLHGLAFLPTAKDDKRWQVNEARILLREGRIKINPRCRNLVRHLEQTVWSNHRQTDYKRKNGEHGDLLDCLFYMVRNIRRSRNPYPHNWGINADNVIQRPKPVSALRLAAGFGRKR